VKRYTPIGFVQAESKGAIWGMQFLWPIKADYRIMYVDSAYQLTVIGREKRDYAWIMARTPRIAAADFDRLRTLLVSQGYDANGLRRMPQLLSP
jgi:apolipoprotein D and lipocalin family protein